MSFRLFIIGCRAAFALGRVSKLQRTGRYAEATRKAATTLASIPAGLLQQDQQLSVHYLLLVLALERMRREHAQPGAQPEQIQAALSFMEAERARGNAKVRELDGWVPYLRSRLPTSQGAG